MNYEEIPGRYDYHWFRGNIQKFTEEFVPIFAGKPNLRFLEVGSFQGESTVWALKYLLTDPSSTIDCIDSWAFGEDQTEMKKIITDEQLFNTFKENTKLWDKQVLIHKNKSSTALKLLRNRKHYYDWAYIDCGHTAQEVYYDSVLSWPLLKHGAYLLWDDYDWSWNYVPNHNRNPEVDNPSVGIDRFLSEIEGQYEIVFKLHQLHVKKL